MKFESKILNVELKRSKIRLIPDVVYSQVPTEETQNKLLQADVLLPQRAEKMPAVIFVTGGGFISSNRARQPQLRMRLAEENFVVASINYRTVPNSTFPAPVEDVKSAIRFFKANAEKFNIDAEKIAVIGDSAGGFLAAFVAMTNDEKIFNVGENLNFSSKIVAAVDLYGVTDIKTLNALPEVLERTRSSLVEFENPIDYIAKNSAPMLLMHGTNDSIVAPEQTDLLFQALKNAGVEAERYLIPNAEHSDEYWLQDEVFSVIVDFLKKHF